MSTTKKPTHGMIREAHVTVNGAVSQEDSTHFPASNLPAMEQGVDRENRDMSISATFRIEQHDEATDEWKPIYPKGRLRIKRRQQNGQISYGTAIVATRTATDIIVGADGKINYAVITGNVETTCKIFQVGRVFVANAGFIESAQFDYDARKRATAAIQQGGSIIEMMGRFQKSAGPCLLEAASSFHDKNPDLYQRMTGDGETLCTAFFGIENDTPILIYSEFEVMFSPFSPDKDTLKVGPGVLALDRYKSWGHTRPLKVFLDGNPGYFARVGDVNAIRNLIQLAISDRPDKVGEPIAIIRVNRTGAEWIEPSPCCPPIESY